MNITSRCNKCSSRNK